MTALYVSARWHVKTHEFDRQVSSYNIRDLNLPEDDVEWVRKAALKTPVILYPKLAGNPYHLFVVAAASVEDGMAQIRATANTLQTKEVSHEHPPKTPTRV